MSGAGSGGAASLINGDNFLKGVINGAVIGGAVAAVSWGINKVIRAATITNGNHEYNKTDSPFYNTEISSNYSGGEKYSYGTVKEFEKGYGSLGNYGVDTYNLFAPDGYGVATDGSFYKKTFWENLWNSKRVITEGTTIGVATGNDIYLSKAAFASKGLLADVITHETGHVIINNSNLLTLANTPTNFKKYSSTEFLDNWGHVSIRKMSVELQKVNPWMNVNWINTAQKSSEFMRYLNSSKPELNKLLQKLIKPFKY